MKLFSRRVASHVADWAPEYTKTASVHWEGNIATIHNIRNFSYRTREDVLPAWYDAAFDMDAVDSVDLVMSYWTGASIAHVFLSFGFANGQRVAISIETRRTRTQTYSALGGFRKNYALIYVVADERDLIGVRTDVRRERVHIYPLVLPPDMKKALLRDYLERVNALNLHPEFYHTLFNNCTTNILRHARAVHPVIRYDWRILMSGYADKYTYDLGLLDRSQSFPLLKSDSLIRRSEDAVIDEQYSINIRKKKPEALS